MTTIDGSPVCTSVMGVIFLFLFDDSWVVISSIISVLFNSFWTITL